MTDLEKSYESALLDARRHIEYVCEGRPCLNDCLCRLGVPPPPRACAGVWRPPRWAKWLVLLAVLAIVLFAAFSASADVICVWNGSSYDCSGDGTRVQVVGGGSGGEPVQLVVTNFWGVCTNCVSMSPSECEQLKSDLDDYVHWAESDLSSARYYADNVRAYLGTVYVDIDSFQRCRPMGVSGSSSVSEWVPFTNYLFSVDNSQTSLVKSQPGLSVANTPYSRARYIIYNDGIYDYAQNLKSEFRDQENNLDYSIEYMYYVSERLDSISSKVAEIECTECQPEYQPGGSSGGGSGGGSGVLTNGNWCTFEQGEAIKGLLGDLRKWAERQHGQLSAISNYVKSSYETLHSGLYSDYNSIPRGEDWQTLYLEGQPTGWGYDPTNILQRIEVLLYGISGISTNVEERLEDTTPDAESTAEDINNSVASVVTDADGTAATTLGGAVVDFFKAFSPRTKDYSGGEEILAEVQYSVGSESFYVPAVRLGSSGFLVDTMSAVKSFVSGFCSVLFWCGGAFAIFRFWIFFAGWCIKLSKWAVELCTSIFAS